LSRREFKRRYLALKLMGGRVFKTSLWSSVIDIYLRLYGEYGLSKAGLRLIEFNEDQGVAIISVNHRSLPYLRAALSLLREVDGKKVIIQVLGVSGTLKRLRRKFLKN